MPECSPSSRRAQHSDELHVYICHARPESCSAHTWMGTTKGHLVPLHSLMHEPGIELDRGKGKTSFYLSFPQRKQQQQP